MSSAGIADHPDFLVGPSVAVKIGPEATTVIVNKNLLCHFSPWCAEQLEVERTSFSRQILLPDLTMDAFRDLMRWLQLTSHDCLHTLPEDMLRLVPLYDAARQYDFPRLRKKIISAVYTDEDAVVASAPFVKLALDALSPACPLRSLIQHQCTKGVVAHLKESDESAIEALDDLPRVVLLAGVRSLAGKASRTFGRQTPRPYVIPPISDFFEEEASPIKVEDASQDSKEYEIDDTSTPSLSLTPTPMPTPQRKRIVKLRLRRVTPASDPGVSRRTPSRSPRLTLTLRSPASGRRSAPR